MNVVRDTSTGLNLVMVENNFEIKAVAIRMGVQTMADARMIEEEAINIFVLFVSLLDYISWKCISFLFN
jgi:hypothetical protein